MAGVAFSQTPERPICINGQAVPRIFVLGHSKCATTTFASDLSDAGAELFDVQKESHMFDEMCGYRVDRFNYTIPGCPEASPLWRRRWLGSIYPRPCSEAQRALVEATPADVRIPRLPTLISGLYGGESQRLGFALLFREPLARLQSQWYMFRELFPGNAGPGVAYMGRFAAYLALQEPRVRWYKARQYRGMDIDKNVGWLYRSLYSLSMRRWLATFRSDQFLVVPMPVYLRSPRDRDAVVRLLAARFGAALAPPGADGAEGAAAAGGRLHAMRGRHPPLRRDVNSAAVAHWYGEYFGPDLGRLSRLLAERISRGLHIVGYEGPRNASDVLAYFCRALGCLM